MRSLAHALGNNHSVFNTDQAVSMLNPNGLRNRLLHNGGLTTSTVLETDSVDVPVADDTHESGKAKRWDPPSQRWPSWEDSMPVADRFMSSANALIAQGRDDLTKTEDLGLHVAASLCELFMRPEGPTPEALIRLQRAYEAMSGHVGIERERARCVQWVAYAAAGNLTAGDLVHYLLVADSRFGVLKDELGSLQQRLKQTCAAEVILAEIIAIDLDSDGALELASKTGEDDDAAVERIRVVLAKAVSKYLRAAEQSEQMP